MTTTKSLTVVQKVARGISSRTGHPVDLVEVGPGIEVAGSGTRWTDGYHAVWIDRDGTRHGRRFPLTEAGEAQARDYFDQITT